MLKVDRHRVFDCIDSLFDGLFNLKDRGVFVRENNLEVLEESGEGVTRCLAPCHQGLDIPRNVLGILFSYLDEPILRVMGDDVSKQAVVHPSLCIFFNFHKYEEYYLFATQIDVTIHITGYTRISVKCG